MADDVPIRFVGPSYEIRRKEADVQRAVNLFPAVMEVEGGKTAAYLRQVPGLRVFSSTVVIVLTSRLYPIVVNEEADITHALTGGNLIAWPLENVDITHALTGGTLNQPLLTYNVPVESVDITHALDSAVLTTVLKTYLVPVESLDITHALTGGGLQNVLLTYSNYPVENVDVTHALTAGTLT